ncbi:hypothetical protein [Phormidesmis priestleyi]
MKLNKEWKIFLTFLLLFAVLTRPIVSSNDASRLATIESLVDYHSFIIDNSRFVWTIDKYFYGGHFYSDKPPILSIYGSIFYAFLKFVGISFERQFMLAYYLLTLLVVGSLTCIALVYFYKTLKLFPVSDKWRDVLVLIAGTGTLLLPYTTVFSNHAVSGALLMIGFYYLLLAKSGIKYAFISGLLIALAGSIDITAFLFAPILAISLIDKPWKTKAAYSIAVAAIFIIYFQLNLHTSGSLTPPAMNRSLWDYPGSPFNETNLSGLAYHSNLPALFNYAFHMLTGNRGLFSYTPILIFSALSFVQIVQDKKSPYRRELLLVMVATSAYILMYIFRSNNYGGWCYGIRWYANLMFLLCLPLYRLESLVKTQTSFRRAFMVLASISIVIAFVGVIHPFVEASETIPSSFFNALSYTAKPIKSDLHTNNPSISLSLSIYFLYFLKQVRLIVIFALMAVSLRFLFKSMKSFISQSKRSLELQKAIQ